MTPTGFAAGAYQATQQLARGVQGGAAFKGDASLGGAVSGASGAGFGQMLSDALNGVAASGRQAETQAVSAASGKSNLVDVVTAVAESETALQTLVAVRDRVIAAYEEIMRMQV